jgi:hypothetical protein
VNDVTRIAGLLLALSASGAASSDAAPAVPLVVHTQLEGSLPAAGDTVDAAPDALVLTFGGLVEESGAVLRLLGPSGRSWALEPARVEGSGRALTSPLPGLEAGGYRLEWRVISGDGHPISGDFVFYVRGGAGSAGGRSELTPPPPPSPEGAGGHDAAGHASAGGAPPAALAATRVAVDVAALLLAGLLLFASLGRAEPSARTAAAARALAVAAPLLAAGYAWVWTGTVADTGAGPAERADTLRSLFTGRALAAELGLLLLAPWALLLARRARLAAIFAALALVAAAFAGHPASHTPVLTIPANALHQLAAAVWIGGLLYLLT